MLTIYRVLLAHMDVAQNARYELYRRTKLKTQTVRKLVNQTLSQSVPQPVIIAVGSYTKAFVGEIIDRALTVRDEWAACRTHIPNSDLPASLLRQGFRTPAGNRVGAKPNLQEVQAAGLGNSVHAAEAMDKEYWVELGEEAGLQEKLKDEYKGPLTPAHLREALRRYNKDREGGGAGFAGMSLEGVERTLARTGGKRLFR
jgi:transcription initiation factor TFIID subunit 11